MPGSGQSEVLIAVTEFLSRTCQIKAGAELDQLELSELNGNVAARASFTRSGGQSTLPLGSSELLACLLIHCKRNRIPLSRHSAKTLKVVTGGLSLTMQHEIQTK